MEVGLERCMERPLVQVHSLLWDANVCSTRYCFCKPRMGQGHEDRTRSQRSTRPLLLFQVQ